MKPAVAVMVAVIQETQVPRQLEMMAHGVED
jgi:hypothetical protein